MSRGTLTAQTGGAKYTSQNPFTRYVVTTSAPWIEVEQILDTVNNPTDNLGSTGLYVDGVAQGDGAPIYILGGPYVTRYALDGASHTLELVNGYTSLLSFGGTQRGLPIVGFRLPLGYSYSVTTPTAPAKRIVVVGTSITVGEAATDEPNRSPTYQDSWMLTRQHAAASGSGTWAGAHVSVDAAGFRRWWDFVVDAPTISAFATRVESECDGTSANVIIWDGLETNDYGSSSASAATIQTNVGSLIDQIHTDKPGISMIFVTATTRGNETTADSLGDTLPNFRTAIANVVSARSTYCTKIDGPPLVTFPTNFQADQLHPNTAGQAEKETHLRPSISYDVAPGNDNAQSWPALYALAPGRERRRRRRRLLAA